MKGCVTLTLAFVPYKPTSTSSFHFSTSATRKSSNIILPPYFARVQLRWLGLLNWECQDFLKFSLPSFKRNWVGVYASNDYENNDKSSLYSKRDWVEGDISNDCEDGEFIVVNFYRFVFIKDPEEEVSKHLSFLQDREIHGRIYLNEQGINAQISPATSGHAFPRLKLRYKPSLLQLEGGISHLPLLDPSMRATPLMPAEWRNRLEAVNSIDIASTVNLNTNVILLDVRNGYEWDIGHFRGAKRPDVDCFRSTSFGQFKSEAIASDPLAHASKKKTEIFMYCTGGIRCDIYSAILRQRGFEKLYTLRGGVSHYLQCEGPVEWIGNLFVFDSRLSLPPAHEHGTEETRAQEVSKNSPFAKCYICGLQLSELRHRNCANLDCNLLFLCCMRCMDNLRGCCSLICTSATRLRPVLQGHQRYKKWHYYRDLEPQKTSGLDLVVKH